MPTCLRILDFRSELVLAYVLWEFEEFMILGIWLNRNAQLENLADLDLGKSCIRELCIWKLCELGNLESSDSGNVRTRDFGMCEFEILANREFGKPQICNSGHSETAIRRIGHQEILNSTQIWRCPISYNSSSRKCQPKIVLLTSTNHQLPSDQN